MEITGRITKDASVFKVSGNKEVLNFSIAVNDSYKPKGGTELKKIVTYIDCSYWLSPKIAEWLKKGVLVELFGRIGLNVYTNADGKAKGNLTFHTSHIKILAFAKEDFHRLSESAPAKDRSKEITDEVPF